METRMEALVIHTQAKYDNNMAFLEDTHLRTRIGAGTTFLRALGESIGTIDKDPGEFWKRNLQNNSQTFIIVEPFDDERIESASYDLSLGDQYYATSDELPKKLRPETGPNYVKLEPGEFAVLTTKEYVYVPADLVGLISVRYTYKQQGLVNVSGFHVDPGFFGKLLFTVYNAGPQDIVLEAGKPIFLIMFAELKATAKVPYKGKHQAQHDIPSDAIASLTGTSVSPRNLEERLKRLELLTYVLTAMVIPIIISLLLASLSK
jgi:dCTP deaminase